MKNAGRAEIAPHADSTTTLHGQETLHDFIVAKPESKNEEKTRADGVMYETNQKLKLATIQKLITYPMLPPLKGSLKWSAERGNHFFLSNESDKPVKFRAEHPLEVLHKGRRWIALSVMVQPGECMEVLPSLEPPKSKNLRYVFYTVTKEHDPNEVYIVGNIESNV